MPDIDTSVQGWEALKSLSIVAFAGAVLWELRQQRNERNQQITAQQNRDRMMSSLLGDLHSAISILLDRAGIKPRKQTHPTGVPTTDESPEAPER